MITYIPRRYTEPKWQARLTEADQQFIFGNGVRISSLIELKAALVNLPDEILAPQIGEEHHLANWVDQCIGHHLLAEELRKQHHRWGLIVTLERQQMRTLNLPVHVARYWLRQTQQVFTFTNGVVIDSLNSLKEALKDMNSDVIDFHLERVPNDISSWVANSIGDFELAEMLEESTNGPQMFRFCEDHLIKLQEVVDSH